MEGYTKATFISSIYPNKLAVYKETGEMTEDGMYIYQYQGLEDWPT